jgi:glycosyltransferase involved in cell wall biosynthesis
LPGGNQQALIQLHTPLLWPWRLSKRRELHFTPGQAKNMSAQAQCGRILLVAYPLLPVSENSAGGAEQVLLALERELHACGHQTVVAAANGSRVSGELFATGEPASAPDQFAARDEEQTRRITERLNSRAAPPFDLIHDMSGGFWGHANRVPVPVLATLHLPRSFYPAESFSVIPDTVHFNCVSESQLKTFDDLPRLLGHVANGIALDRFRLSEIPLERREYVLWLGRICEEKGTHVALDLAHETGQQIIVAGQVYPFLYHQKYFAREVIPRLKRGKTKARFVNSPSFAEKLDLLRNARALLVTSLVDATSSMVVIEAGACGTPVYGFRRGALPEVIADGVNGRLFDAQEELAEALQQEIRISPVRCRQYADEKFSVRPMAERYQRMYAEVARASVSVMTSAR